MAGGARPHALRCPRSPNWGRTSAAFCSPRSSAKEAWPASTHRPSPRSPKPPRRSAPRSPPRAESPPRARSPTSTRGRRRAGREWRSTATPCRWAARSRRPCAVKGLADRGLRSGWARPRSGLEHPRVDRARGRGATGHLLVALARVPVAQRGEFRRGPGSPAHRPGLRPRRVALRGSPARSRLLPPGFAVVLEPGALWPARPRRAHRATRRREYRRQLGHQAPLGGPSASGLQAARGSGRADRRRRHRRGRRRGQRPFLLRARPSARAAGAAFADVERELARRALRVRRRPMSAKGEESS